MSESISGLTDAQAREDALVDGVKKTADWVEANVKETRSAVAKQNDRLDAVQAQIVKSAEKLDQKIEEIGSAAAEKINRLAQRQNPLGITALFAESDTMKAGIAEADRKYINLAEMTLKSGRHQDGSKVLRTGRLSEPVFKAATILWMRDAAAMQLRGFTREHGAIRERLSKLEAAFADAYGKGIDELSEGANPGGGFLVPAPVEAEVIRLIEDNGVMRPLVRKITMTSKTLLLPTKGNAITAYIGAEEGLLTGSYDQTSFASATLTAKRFHGRATASIELMQDSIIGLGDYILTTMAEEIAILEDQEALEGSGTNFTGVIAASGVNSVATTTTDGEAPVYGDLTKTVWAARQRSSRNGARWFASPEFWGKVEGLVDTNGQPIVRLGAVQDGLIRNMLGFPIESVSTLSITITRGATGNTTNAYFGPPTAIIFGDRTGLSFDVSDAPNWANYKMDMRLVKRTAIVVSPAEAFTKLVGSTFA